MSVNGSQYASQGDLASISDDDENDILRQFNRNKNLHSAYYESLKENQRS